MLAGKLYKALLLVQLDCWLRLFPDVLRVEVFVVMVKAKFVLLMLVVAVLFSVFSFSLGNAFYQQPEYEDFCSSRFIDKFPGQNCSYVPVPVDVQRSCSQLGGFPEPVIGDDGCTVAYECNTCQVGLDAARERFNLVIFLFMSILGITAIVASLSLKTRQEVAEWIFNGFLLGGLISLFIGTVVYFDDAPRFLRPIIMFVELGIIIFIALRKLSEDKRRGK